MRWGILLGIILVLMVIPIASASDIIVEKNNIILETNFSSVCLWYHDKPLRECYHDFVIFSKDKTVKSVSTNLKFDRIENTKITDISLDNTSKTKTFVSDKETYRITFFAPPNHHEKYNFSVYVNDIEFYIDPDVSACSTLASGGVYNVTGDIVCNSVYCFTVTANDVWIEGNGYTVTRGTDMNYLVRMNSAGLGNLTIRNLNGDTFDTGLISTYSTNHPNFYYENLNIYNVDIDDLFGNQPVNVTVLDSFFNGTNSDAIQKDIGSGFYLFNNTFNITGGGEYGMFRPDQAVDLSFIAVNNTFNIIAGTATNPIIWYQAAAYNMSFINNTFNGFSEEGTYDLFYFTSAIDTNIQLIFTGNILNVTTSLDDMFRIDAGTFNNGTVSFDYNWYGNITGGEFSDICDDLDSNGICDEWLELTGISGVYDENPMTFLSEAQPYQENIVVTLTSPTGDINAASSVFLIAFNSNATANYSYIIVNATTVQNNSVNGTSWSLNYQTGLLLRESAGYNVTVTACSYYNNSVCDTESIYIDFEYSSGNLLLVIFALVAMAILLLGFYRLYDAGKKGKMGEVLNEIVIYICMMFMLALFTLFL